MTEGSMQQLQLTVRVKEIRAYDDGTVAHGMTHRVTLLGREANSIAQAEVEMNLAMPDLHEVLIQGHDYILTLQPVERRGES
jgi:hypothetical protein